MRYKAILLWLALFSFSTSNAFSQNTGWPEARWGHSMVVMDNKIYIFGGQGNEGSVAKAMSGPTLNDLWAYNEDNSEYEIEPATDSPPPRCNHCCYKDDKYNWFNVHGGYGEQGVLDDMHSYMPSDGGGSWGEIVFINVPLSYTPRYYHTVNEVNDQKYILGGMDQNGDALDDFWQYGVQDGLVRMTPLADYPYPIAGHATITVDDDHLLVLGGGIPGMDVYYQQAHMYTISENSWSEIAFDGHIPPATHSFTVAVSKDQVYMIGGKIQDGMNPNLYRIEIGGNILYSTNLGNMLAGYFNSFINCRLAFSNPPDSQGMNKSAEDQGYLYLFGGMDEDSVATDQMMRYDIAENQWAELTVEGWQDIGTGIEGNDAYPSEFVLNQNYPNPFNSETQIQYALSYRTRVRLQILDIQGKIIKTLVNEIQDLGMHTCSYQADYLPSGIYMIRLQVKNQQWIRKALLTK